MRSRALAASALVVLVGLSVPALASGAGGFRGADRRVSRNSDGLRLPEGFVPAVARDVGRGVYLIQVRTPSLAQRISAPGGALAPQAQREAVAATLRSQEAAIEAAEALGGEVRFRWARAVTQAFRS